MYAVQFPQGVAVIDGYQWASKDKKLEEALNLMLDPDGPSGADPRPDWNAAKEAIKRLGGEIIKSEPRPYPEKDKVL